MTRSPGFQLRTADPTRSTTPDASLPITWYGRSWRAPHTLSRPSRLRNPNVGSGSKIDVHTVLKLMADAMTPTNASSGASSGSGNGSTWVDLRGSLSSDATPSNMSTSSAFTSAPRTDVGNGSDSISLSDAPARMALRIASISAVFVPLMGGKLPAGSGTNHPSLHCPSRTSRHSTTGCFRRPP